MKKTLVAVAVLSVFLCNTALGAWSTVGINTRYPNWYDRTYLTYFNDVINLNPYNFNDQILANAQVQINDSGEWLIMGYGDPSMGDTAVGDAIWVIKRELGGTYKRPAAPAMAYPAEAGKRWDYVGGLGFGAGFAKTPTATTSGDRYFALVPLEDFHTSPPNYWITWAMSPDGENWRFAAAGGGTTTNPALSLKLIRRGETASDPRFLHPTMFYSPTDGYFYFVFGYHSKTLGKIAGLWFRVKYNTSNAYGLTYTTANQYEVERLSGTTYVKTNGALPSPDGSWITSAQLPQSAYPTFSGVADPVGLIRLTKQDGTFDSMLFLYRPESQFNNEIHYVRGTSDTGTFGFSTATRRVLDMSSLRANCPSGECYNKCSAAGEAFFTGPVQSGWQADGNPQVIAYITAFREDLNPGWSGLCMNNKAGFLPVLLNLQ